MKTESQKTTDAQENAAVGKTITIALSRGELEALSILADSHEQRFGKRLKDAQAGKLNNPHPDHLTYLAERQQYYEDLAYKFWEAAR
jgi:hypothetical protein